MPWQKKERVKDRMGQDWWAAVVDEEIKTPKGSGGSDGPKPEKAKAKAKADPKKGKTLKPVDDVEYEHEQDFLSRIGAALAGTEIARPTSPENDALVAQEREGNMGYIPEEGDFERVLRHKNEIARRKERAQLLEDRKRALQAKPGDLY